MKDLALEESEKETERLAQFEHEVSDSDNAEIEQVNRINFTGEIFMRERIDEDTKQVKYSLAIVMFNPFADLFEGGVENEYNLNLNLSFKENKGKIKAQFNYKAKRALKNVDRIEISGYIQRRKFFDRDRYKTVRYIGIFIKSPFDDSEIGLTISRAETLGLIEMFAGERLAPLA